MKSSFSRKVLEKVFRESMPLKKLIVINDVNLFRIQANSKPIRNIFLNEGV